MAGMFINNILYWLDIARPISYCLDFILGNSYIASILIIICSYTFKFCEWHRILIIANFININIAMIDSSIGIPISNAELIILYGIISCIGILCATYCHIKDKHDEK